MDPFETPYWSYFMVLAWVVVRDPEIVNLAGDAGRDQETYDEEIVARNGAKLVILNKVRSRDEAWLETRIVLDRMEDGQPVAFENVEDAAKAINIELQRGTVSASGLRQGYGDVEVIGPENWPHLKMMWGPNGDHVVVSAKGPGPRWNDPRWRRDEVLKCWAPERGVDNHPEARTFAPRAQRKRGRPRGSGSYKEADQPLIIEMQELIDSREETSISGAASAVASKAKGASHEAIVRRLRARYREQR